MARKKKNNAKKEMIFFLVTFILVIVAVICGYVFSNKIAADIIKEDNEVLDESSVNSENLAQNNLQGEVDNKNESPADNDDIQNDNAAVVPVPIDMYPVNVVFLLDADNTVDGIRLELLDCVKMEMLIITLPGDISYTMSSSLYKTLTAGNVTLPQTVTFSELYKYYNDTKAYDFGRQIFCEILGIDVGYYTGVKTDKYYSSYALDSEKEIDYELKQMLDEAVTNWDYPSREKYLTVYGSLRAEDVQFADAPVKKNNESTVLDISGLVSIIHQSGVDLWEKEE